ncbi:unnamed protein product, partial [Closterium sp. NIES-54]
MLSALGASSKAVLRADLQPCASCHAHRLDTAHHLPATALLLHSAAPQAHQLRALRSSSAALFPSAGGRTDSGRKSAVVRVSAEAETPQSERLQLNGSGRWMGMDARLPCPSGRISALPGPSSLLCLIPAPVPRKCLDPASTSHPHFLTTSSALCLPSPLSSCHPPRWCPPARVGCAVLRADPLWSAVTEQVAIGGSITTAGAEDVRALQTQFGMTAVVNVE